MRVLSLTLCLLLQVLLFTCSDGSSDYGAAETTESDYSSANDGFVEQAIEMEAPRTAEPPPPPDATDDQYRNASEEQQQQSAPTAAPAAPITRRVVYTADVRMQVTDVSRATEEIRQTLAQLGGYVSDLDQTNNRYQLSSTLTLRIPVTAFDRALDTLNGWSIFTDYRRLSSRDVTAEWVDIETRLQTKRAVRDRYIEVLRKRAANVKDILAAEEAIRKVTEEIESREGRLRYLRDQTSMSTISLQLYQELEYQPAPQTLKDGFLSRAGRALGGGWEFLQELVIGILAAWPVWIILAVLFYFGRRFFRSRRRK
ncbi:MAG: DUF4349 domain-containing protein [Saprospiraceae bacterium]